MGKQFEDYPLVSELTDDSLLLVKVPTGSPPKLKTFHATMTVFIAKLLSLIASAGSVVVRNDLTSLSGLTNSLVQEPTVALDYGSIYLLVINGSGSLWRFENATAGTGDITPADNPTKRWTRILGL